MAEFTVRYVNLYLPANHPILAILARLELAKKRIDEPTIEYVPLMRLTYFDGSGYVFNPGAFWATILIHFCWMKPAFEQGCLQQVCAGTARWLVQDTWNSISIVGRGQFGLNGHNGHWIQRKSVQGRTALGGCMEQSAQAVICTKLAHATVDSFCKQVQPAASNVG